MTKIDMIQSLMEKAATDGDFSGVCLVEEQGNRTYEGAFGFAHKGFKVANALDIRYDVASVTKWVTGVAMLQLVDKGLVTLTDLLWDHVDLGDSPIPKTVTIDHLLTHTSGIADDADEEAGEDYADLFVDSPNYKIRTLEDFLPNFVHKEPVFQPGQAVRYNNVAFVLLGMILEKVTGMNYRDYVVQHVFGPAHMKGSGFFSMDGVHAKVAEHYPTIEDAQGQPQGIKKNIYSYPPIGSPDGGMHTTAGDLCKFMRALYGGRLLSKAMTEKMTRPQVLIRKDEDMAFHYGYGCNFALDPEDRVIWQAKDGMNAGVASMVKHYPDQDVSVVILANEDHNVWRLSREIHKILFEEQL